MREDVAKLWVEALRSGQYDQTQGTLCAVDKLTGTKSFCCLGVLCDLASTKMPGGLESHVVDGSAVEATRDIVQYGGKTYAHGGEVGVIPTTVKEWSGMNTIIGEFVPEGSTKTTLTDLNDKEGKTFDEIADIIETNWESL